MQEKEENLRELSVEELLARKEKVQQLLEAIDKAISENSINKHNLEVLRGLKSTMDFNKKNGMDIMCIVIARTNTGPIYSYIQNDSSNVDIVSDVVGDEIELKGHIVSVYYNSEQNKNTVVIDIKIFVDIDAVEHRTITFLTKEQFVERIKKDALMDIQDRADTFVKNLRKVGIEIKDFEIKYKE